MKRNKIIALITFIAILLTSIAIFASCGMQASSPDIPSMDAGNITWEFKSDGKVLKITGKGNTPVAIGTFSTEPKGTDTPWYKNNLRNVVEKIELVNVSIVSDYSFFGMKMLKSVEFGSNVVSIGKCAFAFCNSLTEVTIPEGVFNIGESAFEGCASLSKINLPSTLTSIGERAFAYDHNLKNLTMDPAAFSVLSNEQYFAAYEPERTALPDVNATAATTPPEQTTTPETSAPSTETDAPATEAPSTEPEEPKNNVTTIIAIVIFAVVIIGIIVGTVLLMRSNKNQKKDALTVRKNKDEKGSKKDSKKDSKNKKSSKKK